MYIIYEQLKEQRWKMGLYTIDYVSKTSENNKYFK